MQEKTRIQKLLAQQGIASRREIERWIQSGRIKVNGQAAELGQAVCLLDNIEVDGRLLKLKSADTALKVLLYHKPQGEVCTRHDPEGRTTVFEKLPKLHNGRWINVGRLDINTSGLLIFTNNGELANRMMHPSSQLEREYAVRVLGKVEKSQLEAMTQGVKLDDGMARFEHIMDSGGEGANHWYHVVVMEGRNRLVRRLWESQGITVSRLKRVRFGPVFIESKLRRGQFADLTGKPLKQLLKTLNLEHLA